MDADLYCRASGFGKSARQSNEGFGAEVPDGPRDALRHAQDEVEGVVGEGVVRQAGDVQLGMDIGFQGVGGECFDFDGVIHRANVRVGCLLGVWTFLSACPWDAMRQIWLLPWALAERNRCFTACFRGNPWREFFSPWSMASFPAKPRPVISNKCE